MAEDESRVEYVFGYGSLVALGESIRVGSETFESVPGRLRGFRRVWGVAMDNCAAAPTEKHYVDRASGQPASVRVAFLDLKAELGALANGLAVPVDVARLADFDAREVNYSRLDVSACLEPALAERVFVYVGTEEARARCEVPPEEPRICVSDEYLGVVRSAFESLDADSLAEFDATTSVPPFPIRPLDLLRPSGPPDPIP